MAKTQKRRSTGHGRGASNAHKCPNTTTNRPGTPQHFAYSLAYVFLTESLGKMDALSDRFDSMANVLSRISATRCEVMT